SAPCQAATPARQPYRPPTAAVCPSCWKRSTAPAAATRWRWTSSCPMDARASSPSCARSAGWSAPSTSRGAPGPGAGRPGKQPAAFRRIRLAEEPDHTSDDADQADVGGHDRLVGRVFGDQLDVAVAPLEALDGGIAVNKRHNDGAVGCLVLAPDEHQVVVDEAGVDHAVAAPPGQGVAFLGPVGGEEGGRVHA